jgi:hypothetical protein
MVKTEGLTRGQVFAALYNNSQPLGLGILHYDPAPMTEEEAEARLAQSTYVDYYKGRVVKVDFSNPNEFDERLYDRDNGPGAAQRAVNQALDQATRPSTSAA